MIELDDLSRWQEISPARQDELAVQAAGPNYELVAANSYPGTHPIRIHTFRHRTLGLNFNLTPGGSFQMGLSARHLDLLDAIGLKGDAEDVGVDFQTMMPAHRVSISPFLYMDVPLLSPQARALIELNDFDRIELGDADDPLPIYLDLEEVDRVLQATGLRLPTEAEWEYACRGGTESLFYFGDAIPSESLCESLAAMNFVDNSVREWPRNPFGLSDLTAGEFCADGWHESYDGAPNNGSAWKAGKADSRVIRGGGAAFWPWQHPGQAAFLLSAYRHSNDEDPWFNGAAVRLCSNIRKPS